MASVAECFPMLSLSNSTNNCSIHSDLKETCLILTLLNKRVFVVQVEDHRLVCDWSLKASSSFSCPVVPYHSRKKYAGVLGNQVVRLWDRDASNIEKSTKITVPKDIHSLLPAGDSIVIVYADTTAAWINKPDLILGEPSKQRSLTWCDLAVIKDTVFLVEIIKTKEENKLLTLQFSLESGDAVITQCSLKECGDVVCYCLQHSDSGISLLGLAADGKLYETDLTRSSMTTELVSMVPGVSTRHVSMVSLDHSQVAVSGVKEKAGSRIGMGLWNKRYDTLQCWQAYPENCESTSKLYRCGDYLVFGSGVTLYAFPLSMKPATLKTVLAKNRNEIPQYAQSQGDSELVEVLDSLCYPVKTSTQSMFKAGFENLSRLWPQKQESPALALHLQPYFNRLVLRCISQKLGFWPDKQLQWLLEKKLVHPSVSSALCVSLRDRKELGLMYQCLKRIHDLPETAVVTCLATFTSASDKEFGDLREWMLSDEEISKDPSTSESEFSPEKCHCLCTALALPNNSVFVVDALQGVDLKTIQLAAGWSAPSDLLTKPHLSLIQVVDWISMLIDSHFSQLVLSQLSHSLILDLHTIVQQQVGFYEELVSLEGVLTQLKEKCVLPVKQHVGHYCIQTLHI